MRFEQLVHRVESHLVELLQGGEKEQQADEISLVKAEIARRQTEAAQAGSRRAEVVERLEKNTTTAALLPSQIESSFRRGKSSQAIRQALELERIRREMGADRDELSRLDQAIWSLGFRLRLLRRQLSRLQADRPR